MHACRSTLEDPTALAATALLATAAPLAFAAETISYSYDVHGRLGAAGRSGGPSSGLGTHYSYDPADNRTRMWTGAGAPPAPPAPRPPAFSVGDVSVTEGGVLAFTVSKHGSTTSSYSVDYATGNGSAAAGTDYTPVSGTLVFNEEDYARTVSVSSTHDTAFEPDETFVLTLSGGGGASFSDAQATGTLVNDDSSNQPPVGVYDQAYAVNCAGAIFVDVIANDTDPDGHYPLTLVSIQSVTFGQATAWNSTTIRYAANGPNGWAQVVYVLRDTLGATATGTLDILVDGQCN